MNSSIPQEHSVSAQPCSVSDFVRQVRRHLEAGLPLGWVCGEVSGLTRAASGHLYFTLKDADAQLRCAMWRTRAQLLPFQLREGMQVEVRAQITVYEARGELQLSVDSIRQAGRGNLFEAFLRLKARLEAEGLFDPARKRPLPRLPRCIGLVSSPQAAALHDVLSTLKRRAPGLEVILYPTRVQGEGAAQQIAAAIDRAGTRAAHDGCEALLLCRGGGSLEDLWAFNEEVVVRAIAASPLPLISGVGHETDLTLADFAADLRAATPTAAAEHISAGHHALREHLAQLHKALQQGIEQGLQSHAQGLDRLDQRLRHPSAQLSSARARLDHLALRLAHSGTQCTQRADTHLAQLASRLRRHAPRTQPHSHTLQQLAQRLRHALNLQQQGHVQHIDQLGESLKHLNPALVMQRGYAIVRNAQGQIVRDAALLHADEPLALQFADSSAQVRVTATGPARGLSAQADPD